MCARTRGITANGYNIAAWSSIEKKHDREAVGISGLNAEIARIVARQMELLMQIEAIVADLEGVEA